ncbi:MAG: hypothetical protein JXA46_17740 [Dehalococcoidales bacterium]|nr:hypothetical protein [Dehalococcoidales bacterium]
MYDAIQAEERNIPTVTLYNEGFPDDVLSAASSKQMPTLRMISTSVHCEASITENIEAGITAVLDNIVAGLTSPLTEEEKSPKPREVEKCGRVAFTGNIQEVNRFVYQKGWGDGLPVIPPTEEAVAEMLKGTDLPPDHVVGKLVPREGKATVEKIAINAVMAGALPTYMPVIIAAVQICADPSSGFTGWGGSTGSWAPFWVINGPIRKDIHINCGTGCLSPGDIANAAIGRAMQFIIRNIGGIRKGIEDMGTLGNPGKYSMVIGEDEERSPWEPMHVEYGFKKEDSTIFVSTPNTSIQIWPHGADDAGIMRAIACNLVPGRQGGFRLMLVPQHARTLAEYGWSKKDVKQFISSYARVPVTHLGSYWGTSGPNIDPRTRLGLWRYRVPMIETDYASITPEPESIQIIVAGGPGAFIGIHSPAGFYPSQKVSQKIQLPANWSDLLAKYRNAVPTFLRY